MEAPNVSHHLTTSCDIPFVINCALISVQESPQWYFIFLNILFFFFYPEAYTPQNHCTKTSLHRFQWQHCERDRHRSTDLTKANEIPASTLPPTPYSRICHTGPITWLRWDSISLGTKWYNNTCSAYLIEPFIIRQQTQSSTCGNGFAGLGELQ